MNPERYYAERAREYEKIYAKPERQHDLVQLHLRLQELLAGHSVLEIACGTGYWTERIVEVAQSIQAVDINEKMLEVALTKDLPFHRVQLIRDDIYSLNKVAGHFTAGFAGFWWSHVCKRDLPSFLSVFQTKLQPGALMVFVDNLYVTGSSTPISRMDDEGNTYQKRKLEDGAIYEIVKNFPEEEEIRQYLPEAHFERLQYFWIATYSLPTRAGLLQ